MGIPARSAQRSSGKPQQGGDGSATGAGTAAVSAFGRMALWLPTGPLELGPPRRRAVLALLLINAGKVVSISSMVRSIWETEPPDHAIATLQSYVSRLRRMIADRPLHGGAELQLEYRSPGYLLNAMPEHVDVMRFESAVGQGLAAQRRGDLPETFALASVALRLWTAPPFEDLTGYEFAAQEAVRLDQLRLAAVEARAAVAFALGRSEEVLPGLEREVADHPTRERLVYQLMRSQYHNGRQADALRLFERTRQYLADELGADVSPQLRQVHEEILHHDPSLARFPGGSGSPLVAARAAERPVSAAAPVAADWQHGTVDRPGLPCQPGRLVTGAPAAFVGRREELRRLLAAAQHSHDGEGRTVLVVGEAGLGKTRLVRELGRLCQESGTDVVTVNCPPSEDMPPYWPWTQALRRVAARRPDAMRSLPDSAQCTLAALVPELAPDKAPGDRPELSGAGRFALHDAVSQALLGTARRPLVLVLEDFQWADAASLHLLPFLTRQSADSRFLLVVTLRSFRIADDPGLRATRAAVLQSLNAEEVRLDALSLDETRRVVAGARGIDPELCAALHERAGGNPYLLLGLLESLRDTATVQEVHGMVPPVIREVINERLSGLPAEILELLNSCAAAGPGGVHGAVPRGAVDRAVRGGLLVADETAPEGIGFVHQLIRDVVRQELTDAAPYYRPTVRATAPAVEHSCAREEAMPWRAHVAAAREMPSTRAVSARVAEGGSGGQGAGSGAPSTAGAVSPGTPWPSRPR
ncbi:BTAD domain-containing putative transcriptional regulator [Streptomyces sp. NPDC051636]|uniref:BTAD domain-containing putative transcriptional regulator n=1 Tax=Streptomyces sp. NPDC051636 TaxID=3365663 RepID=UPI0037AB747B